MQRARLAVITLLLAVTTVSCAQMVVVDTMLSVQPLSRQLYSFPIIRMPGNERIAARVQHDLCVDFLDVDPDTAEGHWFDRVWGGVDIEHPWMPRLNSLEWSCGSPTPGILVIELSAEGCGMYCEGFERHYNYDLSTGDRLEFDSLFSNADLIELNGSLVSRWRTIVLEHVRTLEDSVIQVQGKSPEPWLLEALELYRSCLNERPNDDPWLADMELGADGMHVWVARCSNHADLAIDELLNVELDLPYDLLAPHLKPAYRWLAVR